MSRAACITQQIRSQYWLTDLIYHLELNGKRKGKEGAKAQREAKVLSAKQSVTFRCDTNGRGGLDLWSTIVLSLRLCAFLSFAFSIDSET